MVECDFICIGVEVDFFGEFIWMLVGLVKLVVEIGVVLLFIYCWFEGCGWGFQVYLVLDCISGDVVVIIQVLVDCFVQNIVVYFVDWYMLQFQWLVDLFELWWV